MWLGIDTTTRKNVIALYDNGVIAERIFEPRATQRIIFSELSDILPHDVIEQLDGIVVGLGPGSFTGVKIGVIAAKTLAWARSIPLVGIGSIDIVAAGMELPENISARLLIAVPSTRGESYIAMYRICDGIWAADSPIYDIPLSNDSFAGLNISDGVILSGEGAEQVAQIIQSSISFSIADEKYRFPRASGLFSLAEERFKSKLFDDPISLKPMYIRPSQPEILERKANS